jgi:hypothetical protein
VLKLRVIQAEFGDCLILECGKASDLHYVLIDGGPAGIYDAHLREELKAISDIHGKLDLVILSHVDNDHVIGLLDLIAELRGQKANDEPETIAINALWHNTFSQTIGSGNDIEARVNALATNDTAATGAKTAAGVAIKGISEGHRLGVAASAHGIPINPGFSYGVVSLENTPGVVTFGDTSLHIVGPTERNLKKLRNEWLDWLREQDEKIPTSNTFFMAMTDRSFQNLSSIVVLAQAGEKKILLTGDGRGDHIYDGLSQAGLLDAEGHLHVDVLKIPHHGSNRNIDRQFFKNISANIYVISANGKYGNPDLAPLIWIVEAARERDQAIELFVTNATADTQQLLREYSPVEYDYRLTVMTKYTHSALIEA